MPPIRAMDLIGAKFAERAGSASPQYEMGVRNPTADYAANAAAAAPAFAAGVQAAIANNRFAKGVAKAGTAKWQERASKLGPGRYAQGVQVARPDYEAGFSPYRETIQSTTLPPRGPRRAPQNLQRVNAMVQALSARKEALSKGG